MRAVYPVHDTVAVVLPDFRWRRRRKWRKQDPTTPVRCAPSPSHPATATAAPTATATAAPPTTATAAARQSQSQPAAAAAADQRHGAAQRQTYYVSGRLRRHRPERRKVQRI